jgi:hypothetical protein
VKNHRRPAPTRDHGQAVAPFFCLTRAAWIPYALTWDPETGALRGVEGAARVRQLPRGGGGEPVSDRAPQPYASGCGRLPAVALAFQYPRTSIRRHTFDAFNRCALAAHGSAHGLCHPSAGENANSVRRRGASALRPDGRQHYQGQGFLRQQGGGVVTCAGSTVLLMPATSFFREFINHYRSGRNPELGGVGVDPGLRAMIKQSQCDAQGNFAFSSLPDGRWFVVTEVKWTVRYAQQGGALMQELSVANGETAQVLLTEKDWVGR